ncbi:hypothetical protein EIP86_009776 [Pleurotus ostreatoroseus]|nr:hypothetical protein EIP86_009776 [Pleurotus ostreatoroseus]
MNYTFVLAAASWRDTSSSGSLHPAAYRRTSRMSMGHATVRVHGGRLRDAPRSPSGLRCVRTSGPWTLHCLEANLTRNAANTVYFLSERMPTGCAAQLRCAPLRLYQLYVIPPFVNRDGFDALRLGTTRLPELYLCELSTVPVPSATERFPRKRGGKLFIRAPNSTTDLPTTSAMNTRNKSYQPPQLRPTGVQTWPRGRRGTPAAPALPAILEGDSPLTELSSPSPRVRYADLLSSHKPGSPAGKTAATANSNAADSPKVKSESATSVALADGTTAPAPTGNNHANPPDHVAEGPLALVDGAASLAAALAEFEHRDPLPPAKLPRTSTKRGTFRAQSLPPSSTPSPGAHRTRTDAQVRDAAPSSASSVASRRPKTTAGTTPDAQTASGQGSTVMSLDPGARSSTCARAPIPPPTARLPASAMEMSSPAAEVTTIDPSVFEMRGSPTSLSDTSDGPAAVPSSLLNFGDVFPSASPPPEGALWGALHLLLSPTPEGMRRLVDPPFPQQNASPPEIPSDADSASRPPHTPPGLQTPPPPPPPSPASVPPATAAPDPPARATSVASSVLSYLDLATGDAHGNAAPATSAEPAPANQQPPHPPPLTSRVQLTGIAAQLEAAARARPSATAPKPANVFVCTPRPAAGFGRIHRLTAGSPFDKQRLDQVCDWDKSSLLKLLLQVVGYGALARRNARRVPIPTAALNLVRGFLGHDGPRLSPPNLDGFLDSRQAAPHSFLLWNLSKDDKARLRFQEVISTEDLTIILIDFSLLTPFLLGMITGLDSHNVDEVYLSVRPTLEGLLPAILDIAAVDNEEAANAPRGAMITQILDSLEIRLLEKKGAGGRDEPEFYVYAHLPIHSIEHFESAREILMAADWRHSFFGNGTFMKPRDHWCTLCHGVDHPRGLCPLPATPGWLGPPNSGRFHTVDDDEDDAELREYDRELREQRRERERLAAPPLAAPVGGGRKRQSDNAGRSDRRKAPRHY